MFQFPGFALVTLCIQVTSPWLTPLLIPEGDNNRVSGGFPHSEIFGSKPIPGSPKLIAGYHVLHRLLLPRHPPNALIALDSIRKKKDLAVPQPRSKASSLPVPSRHAAPGTFWLVYLTWTTPPLTPFGTIAPTLGCDRQRVSLSERCEAIPKDRSVRLDGTATAVRSSRVWSCVMVEPDGVEPTTSCLQSRRSTN